MSVRTTSDLDQILARLAAGALGWAQTPLTERADLLDQVADLTAEHAEEWVRVATQIKQLEANSPLVGEEWLSGPYAVISSCRTLAETVRHIAAGQDVLQGYGVRPTRDGGQAVRVLPHTAYDRILFSGFTADVLTRPGVTAEQLRATAGLGERTPTRSQGVAAVLGAGNIFSIAPLDVLYQLYADNRTAILKLNPVTDPLLPVFRAVFAPLVDRDLVEIVTGGADVGERIVQDPGVASVHMTGSEATHDAIVWGVGAEAVAARAANAPRLDKPITSELGGVSPVIIVPGPWSPADLRFQAEHVATQRLQNNGSNCIAAQVVIVSADWDLKGAFLAELSRAVAGAPPRPDWYPGTAARVQQARDQHRDEVDLGPDGARVVLPSVDLADDAEPALAMEYFGPVLGVSELPGEGADYLAAAVAAANERLRGTLGANVIAHPQTIRALGAAFEEAAHDLRHGTVAVNAWTGVGFATPRATWGAFPGHTLADVQSGIGVVHNTLLLADTERTVIRGPFRPFPRSVLHGEWSLTPVPPWFVSSRTAVQTGRLLTAFAARPGVGRLLRVVASALRG